MRHGKAFEALPREALTSSVRVVLCAFALAALWAGPALSATVDLDADGSGTAIGIPAADPTIYNVSIVAAGESPQLGEFRVQAQHVTNASTGAISQGTLTLQLLHGDKLYGTYTGSEAATSSPTIFTASGTITFTGGTGHFKGATGMAAFTGELQILHISQAGVVREAVTLHLDGQLKF